MTEQKKPDKKELRKFGIIFGAILSGLFGLLLPFLLSHPIPEWPWIVSATLVVLALVLPHGLIIVYVPWMKFGAVAGWINTRIILGVLFFLIITPFGLIIRLFGGDLLKKKLDSKLDSYRVVKEPQSKDHMETPY